MRIPSTQKVRIEDFPDQRDWIVPLVSVLNKFISDVIASINGSIEFERNILGTEKEMDFVYISHTLSLPLTFKWPLAQLPKALYVVSASENSPATNSVFSPIMVNCAWVYTQNNEISITDIVKLSGNTAAVSDLVATRRYKIRFRVTP